MGTVVQEIGYFMFVWVIQPICWLGLSLCYYSAYSLVILLDSAIQKSNGRSPSWLKEFQMCIQKLKPHPDIYRSTTNIITAEGFHFETHQIITEDKYILTAWRIYKEPTFRFPHPIVLQHGLLDCSWSWFVNNSHQDTLPYILANKGYDVWLLNNRGNKYSIGHSTILNPNYNRAYWDYSFDELVKYDVKANVLYVKKITKKDKVIYIGHSQGTTQLFAHQTLHPEFQQHLKCFIGFGPAIYISKMKSTFIMAMIKFYVFEIIDWLGIPYFFVFSDDFNVKIGALCNLVPWIYRSLFFAITNLLCGYPAQNKINLSRFGLMVSKEPGGCSTRNIVQWMQFFRTKDFCQYDFGSEENLLRYGQPCAPRYQVEKLKEFTIPKYLYVGEKDVIIDEDDLAKIIKMFVKGTYKVEIIHDYAHLDYLWSVDAYKRLYPQVLKDIEENNKI